MNRLDAKLDGASKDTVKYNIEMLLKLFPEVLVEGRIHFDILRETLGEFLDDSKERYSFTWNGKSNARRIAQTPSTGTLRPCPQESVNWDTTKNLFIEGDNLEVLKLLQKSFHKKVKMIYIDPPYNTGKDFIYPDNFKDSIKNYMELTGQTDDEGKKLSTNPETSGRYHTDWLNMMYPRLKLARNLLREDGVIFISIDDCEVANLRKLCDEIFGEENFVANVIWQKKYTRSNDAKWFSDNHDHILCYARLKDAFRVTPLPRSADQIAAYSNPDHHAKGPWKATPLHAKSGTNSSSFVFSNGVTWQPPTGTYRRFNDESMCRMEEADEIWFGENSSQIPQRKSFLSEVKKGVTPITLWPYTEVGHNHEANNELKALNLKGIFSNPKPTRLLRRMCILSDTDGIDGIVLDFFAGSATCAHAVFDQNVADNGCRRFIVVQLPEICSEKSEAYKRGFDTIADISKERIRRVIKKIEAEQAEKIKENKDNLFESSEEENKLDLGFKVFKLDSSNIKPWDADFDNLDSALLDTVENIKLDRSEEDVLYELLLKFGLDLSVPIEEQMIAGKTVYIIGAGALIVCLAEEITIDVVEGIAPLKKEFEQDFIRVVFKDSGFANDVVKTNAKQILKQAGFKYVRSL